ncbi:unnamed protein product [Euphydryas editha]|uniref:Uncharacterized protein n=1 Tax=Euphydryas editha TaxID=104508 RepID=A0AAU9V4E2_EUPED|nr:unnamed protein product [Euphydryas editha]
MACPYPVAPHSSLHRQVLNLQLKRQEKFPLQQQGRILLTQGYYATQGAWFSDLAHSGKEPAYHLAYGVPLELRNGCRLIAFVSVVEVVVGFLKLIHALILALTGQTSIEKHFS